MRSNRIHPGILLINQYLEGYSDYEEEEIMNKIEYAYKNDFINGIEYDLLANSLTQGKQKKKRNNLHFFFIIPIEVLNQESHEIMRQHAH